MFAGEILLLGVGLIVFFAGITNSQLIGTIAGAVFFLAGIPLVLVHLSKRKQHKEFNP